MELVENDENEKDGRLQKQVGDFGESLVMFWLGQTLGYSVALVDHEGADIIAAKDGKQLAISVKTRCFGITESPDTTFNKHNQVRLEKFRKKFGCEKSAVAFVLADKRNGKYIDIYLIKMDLFKRLCNDVAYYPYFTVRQEKGQPALTINNRDKNGARIREIKEIERIRLETDMPLFKESLDAAKNVVFNGNSAGGAI